MEPKFNTSFIPKKSLQADVSEAVPGKYVNRRSTHGPGFFLSIFFLVAMITVSGSVFGYVQLVEKRINTKSDTLEHNKNVYAPEDIQTLVREDARLREAEKILTAHVALTELFDLLEVLTIKDVYYTKFAYREGKQGETPYLATLDGEAPDVEAAMQQVDQFEKNEYISSASLSSLQVSRGQGTEKKNAGFGVELSLDSRLISYPLALEGGRRDAALITPQVEAPAPEVVPKKASSTALFERGDLREAGV